MIGKLVQRLGAILRGYPRWAQVRQAQRRLLSLEALEDRLCPALTIQLDFDTYASSFFADPSRRALMQRVADTMGSLINDHLAAITPSGGNTWTATFVNPTTGAATSLDNLSIPADTVRIFVGALNIDGPGGTVGDGGYGGWQGNGSSAWLNTLSQRGKPANEFSTWGGQVMFDSSENWYFGTSAAGLSANQVDFFSVAMHELGHALGLQHLPAGTTDSEGFQSDMTPSITDGTRKLFNRPDLNNLASIGWHLQTDPDASMAGAVDTRLGGAGTWSINTASISNPVDVDLYRFQAQAGEGLTAVTSARPGGVSMDTYLRLFDANGHQLAWADNGAYDTLSGTFTSAGTYYLGVSASPNTAYSVIDPLSRTMAGSPGDYNFQITLTGGTPSPTTPPVSPTLTGPTASSQNTTPVITWSAVTGATQYDLWVDNQSLGLVQVIRQQNLATNSYTPTTPLSAGTYVAWVRAANSVGTSDWSASESFTILAPDTPVLAGPSGALTSHTPAITWSASTGASCYDLWVDNTTTGQGQVIRQQNLTTTSYTPTSGLPSGTYQAWVRAINPAGDSSGWSASQTFTILVPDTPIVTGPSGSSTNHLSALSWTASATAAFYDLWVDNTTLGISQFIRQQNLTSNSFTPGSALPAGTYTMWVRAVDAYGSRSNWSAGTTFTILAAPPAAPVVAAPAGPTTNTTPTFSWSGPAGAASYELWVDNASTGQSQVIHLSNLTGTSYTPATPLSAGTYLVYVRAANSYGEQSGWSAGQSFTIQAPAFPVVLGPIGTTSNHQPLISWSASPDAAFYDLWVDNATTGDSQFIRQPSVTTTTYTPTVALPTGSFRVWVRARNNAGDYSAWSSPLMFTLA
jgi:hypothetical protein